MISSMMQVLFAFYLYGVVRAACDGNTVSIWECLAKQEAACEFGKGSRCLFESVRESQQCQFFTGARDGITYDGQAW